MEGTTTDSMASRSTFMTLVLVLVLVTLCAMTISGYRERHSHMQNMAKRRRRLPPSLSLGLRPTLYMSISEASWCSSSSRRDAHQHLT